MFQQKYIKFLLAIAVFVLGLNFSAFAVQTTDNEAPPSLNIVIPPASDNEAPPSLNIIVPPASSNPQPPANSNPSAPTNPSAPANPSSSGSSNIILKITKADAYPRSFNPTVSESKITYAVNKEAIILIKITNSNNLVVARLIEDKKVSAGEYFVNWKGTDRNERNGQILPAGTYEYKIQAKDPNTGEIKDTADGEINLIYSLPQNATSGYAEQPVQSDNRQTLATMMLNNASSGTTAKTGPGILIYAIFPLAFYLISNKKKS